MKDSYKGWLLVGVAVVLVGCQKATNDQASSSSSVSSVRSSSSTSSSSTSSSSMSSIEEAESESSPDLLVGSEQEADLSLGYLMIVNKKHRLPADYAPGEDQMAGEKIRELIRDMQSQGFAISNQYSGYRSYTYQKELYDGYVSQMGTVEADKTSARPGYSEHQSGLAFDILNSSGQLLGEYGSADDEAVVWLHANVHRYGFVLRYLAGKEDITGYSYEPWHLRYVGSQELARDIYESGLTLEEYYHVSGGDYAQ